jgi:hypothetical protein
MILCCIVQSQVNKNCITLHITLFLCDGAHAMCMAFVGLFLHCFLELVGTCFSVSESVHQFCPIVCEMVETLFVN